MATYYGEEADRTKTIEREGAKKDREGVEGQGITGACVSLDLLTILTDGVGPRVIIAIVPAGYHQH